MNVFEIIAKIVLNSDEYESGLDKAKGLAVGAGKAMGAAVTAASAAVVAFGKSSVEAGMSFDKSMSQVVATMGNVDDMSGESLDKLKEYASNLGVTFDDATTATELSTNALRAFAQEMGSATAFSATQAADALNYMALAGYDATTSIDMLPNVLNLAAAGGIELARASDMVTDAQSALGLSLDETSELVDKMAKASSKSNTSVAQLGDAILTVGGTAKNLAGGTTELSTALGILADNGIKGSEGGTALRNVILSLAAPTDQAAKLMDSMGLNAYDASGNLRPLEDIFLDLNGVLSEMTQGEQTEVLNTLFNKVDLKSANALLATSAERWDELAGSIDNASGAAETMADTQLDNLAGDITLFQSALEGAQIAVSDGLTPSLRDLVQFGTDGVSRLTTAFREGGLSGAMDIFGSIIADGLAMVTEKLPMVVEAGTQLLMSLIDGIITNLPVLADAAVQIVLMIANSLANAYPDIYPKIADVIVQIANVLTDPSNLSMLVDAAVAIMLGLAQGLIAAIPTLIGAVPEIVKNLVEAITANAPKLLAAAFELVVALALGLVEAIPELLMYVPELILAIVSGLVDGIGQIMQTGEQIVDGLIDGIVGSFDRLVSSVRTFVDNFVQSVKNFLGIHSPSTVFKNIGSQIVNGIISGITSLASGLINAGRNLISNFTNLFTNVPDSFRTIGSNIVTGLVNGVSSMVSSAVSSVRSFASSVVSAAQAALGVHSPSTVFAGIGKNLVAGLENGWDNEIWQLRDKIDSDLDFGTQSIELSARDSTAISMHSGTSNTSGGGGSMDIVSALQRALQGMQINMDGSRVGYLTTNYQSSRARALGV